MSSFVDELKKIANTRYNREIAAGNITRADLVPEASQTWAKHEFPSIIGDAQRKKTHEVLRSYVPPTYDGKFTQEHANKLHSLQSTNQIKHVDSYVPNTTGSSDLKLGPHPITIDLGSDKTIVHAPALSTNDLSTAIKGTKVPAYEKDMGSLNHAFSSHEIGEASEISKYKNSKVPAAQAFASHFGVEPILRENISLSKATPNAQHFVTDMRTANKDDALVSRLITQAGGTPNSPIPIDGSRHKALKRMVDANVSNFTPETRQRALQLTAGGIPSTFVPSDLNEFIDRKIEGSIFSKMKQYKDGILRYNKFVSKGL